MSKSSLPNEAIKRLCDFLEWIDRDVLAELSDIRPLRSETHVGCRIGGSMKLLRDLETNEFIVLSGQGATVNALLAQCAYEQLFSAPSAWLEAWFQAQYLERIRVYEFETGTPFRVFDPKAEGTSRWILSRVISTDAAKTASKAVAEALAVSCDDIKAARRYISADESASTAPTFHDVEWALRMGKTLVRLAIEHPHWTRFIVQHIQAQEFSMTLDPMAQLKRRARSAGLSKSAWARLSRVGLDITGGVRCSRKTTSDWIDDLDGMEGLPMLYLASDTTDPEQPDLATQWHNVVAVSRAINWVGDVWLQLHPEFRRRVVECVYAYPRDHLGRLEQVLTALGREAGRRVWAFDGMVALENNFSKVARTLEAYGSLCMSGYRHLDLTNSPPKRSRWDEWVRWSERFEDPRALPIWVPLERFSTNAYVATALTSRAEIAAEGRQMGNCIASYFGLCFQGTYALYRIEDRSGGRVATFGAKIDVTSADGAAAMAMSATFDEVSGQDHRAVDDAVRAFVELLMQAINHHLPALIMAPDALPQMTEHL